MPPKPNNHLVFSILVTLFCCLPLGVVAIVKSCAVDSAYNAGNYPEAEACSKSALTLCIVSASIAIISSLLAFVLSLCGVVLGF